VKTLFLIFAIALLIGEAKADPLDVYGLWLTEAGDGHVNITDCGDGTPCGALVWVDPAQTPINRDVKNPDLKLRNRPLIGVPIIWGYRAGRRIWRNGRIYNPDDGKTFGSSLQRLENGNLKVKGCLGPLCVTNLWTPVNQLASEEGRT